MPSLLNNKGARLTAGDLVSMTKWPDILVEDYLSLGEQIVDIIANKYVSDFSIVTGSYTVTQFDYLIECTSAVACDVTLPDPSTITGREYLIKNSGIGAVTVSSVGGETIDDQLTQVLAQYDAMKIMSNGTNWIIV